MPLDAGTFLLLMVLGGMVAMDGTSFGQVMISRPFVAATLAGWLVGDPVHGALLGVVLEAFHLNVLPIGAARYPEGGPAAVAGGAIYATSNLAPSTLLLTVLFVLALEWVGGESVRYLRQTNVRLVPSGQHTAVSPKRLEIGHVEAMGLDFVRGIFLVAGGTVLLALAHSLVGPFWGLGERVPQVVLTGLVAGLLTSAAKVVGWRGWFVVGGAAGGVLFLILAG
jgi:mannose/fructose/N-acetylgalactosamine-specific phosphotransferase system component IIC